MPLQIPGYLYTFIAATSTTLLLVTLTLIWLSATRVRPNSPNTTTTAIILSLTLLGWYAAAHLIGAQNTYWAPNNPVFPLIIVAIAPPVAIGLWLLTRSNRVALLIDALPISMLVGVQFYRTLGFMFLVLWSQGHLPWQFALPAGIGDIAVGVLALVVAAMLATGAQRRYSATYAWCIFGIVDLVVAVTMGWVTSPGIAHLASLDAPNMLVTAYPLVMVPTFAVPLSIILHGLCLWKLQRICSSKRAVPA